MAEGEAEGMGAEMGVGAARARNGVRTSYPCREGDASIEPQHRAYVTLFGLSGSFALPFSTKSTAGDEK